MSVLNAHFSNFKNTVVLLSLFISLTSINANADDLDDFLRAQISERKIPGLQLAVIKNGKIVRQNSYGTANIQDNIAVTNNTVFPLNSITKAFVGVAMMQLVEQGKIDLDARLDAYLPDIPEAWKKVTVKQAFTHISGLPEILRNDGQMMFVGGQDVAWEKVKELPVEFEPTTQFKYNQTGYVLIGKIIETVSGMSFVDFITENQLEKVVMPKTIQAGFTHSSGIVPNQARNYTFYNGGKLTTVQEEFPPILRTAAGMSSTTTEIAKWIIALNNGELIRKKSIDALWTPATLQNGDTAGFNSFVNGYAIGWPVIVRASHPAAIPIGGNRTVFAVYPDDDLSVIILTNLVGGLPDQFVDEVAGFYIADMKIENGFTLSDDLNDLRLKLDKNGYARAKDIATMLQENANISFNEAEINAWGYKLLSALQKTKAVEIFKLNTALFPSSANTYDSLADGYARMGNTALATENYQKVLELEPGNGNASYQLNLLRQEK